jgi:hypothetical protein
MWFHTLLYMPCHRQLRALLAKPQAMGGREKSYQKRKIQGRGEDQLSVTGTQLHIRKAGEARKKLELASRG